MRPSTRRGINATAAVNMKVNFWSPAFRIPVFLVLFVSGYAASTVLPILSAQSNLLLVYRVLGRVTHGDMGAVARPDFAFALACAVVSVAFGLAFAMLFLNVMGVILTLRTCRKRLERPTDPRAFKANFDSVDQACRSNGLIGHAWSEFIKTCVLEETVQRTVRPQSFLNAAVARERLFGLKLMITIPGYFVGLGLLLTFVGLVIALSKAAGGVSGSPDQMRHSLQELLDAATFKFATSIAGLFSSLALALIFKTYAILIDMAFDRLCKAIETVTLYVPQQVLMGRLCEAAEDQVQQLKEITDERFFDRFGERIAPALESAFQRAVEPLTTSLDAAVGKLDATSRDGMKDLLADFTKSLHGGAGTEIRELAATLGQAREALSSAQSGLVAANDANRQTGERLVAALTTVADTARDRLDDGVTQAASSATQAIAAGMDEVLGRVSAQMDAFAAVVTGFQDGIGREAERAAFRSREASTAAADAAGQAASEAAQAVKSGFADVVGQMRAETDKMVVALRSAEVAFSQQAGAARRTAEQTQEAATAFGGIAASVNAASKPLVESSVRFADSTGTMARAVASASDSLTRAQDGAAKVAQALQDHLRHSEGVWRDYESRFKGVDESLTRAVEGLAARTREQQEIVARFVKEIDAGCGQAVQKLSSIMGSLNGSASEMSEAIADLVESLPRKAA